MEMKIDKVLTEQMAASVDAAMRFPAIVTLGSAEDLAPIQALGIQPDRVFENIAAFSARLTASEIATLAELSEVRLIEADQPAHAIGTPR